MSINPPDSPGCGRKFSLSLGAPPFEQNHKCTLLWRDFHAADFRGTNERQPFVQRQYPRFANAEHPSLNHRQAFNDGCDHYNLRPTTYFWEKVVQIYDMMVVRHGFMIVGLPFSGKTMAWKVLAYALGLLHTR